MSKSIKILAAALLVSVGIGAVATASMNGDAEIYNVDNRNIAVGGYDVVSYLKEDKAVAGSARFAAEHGGVTFHFASAENRDIFQREPQKYVPEFGGFCAFGIRMGKKLPIDPSAYTVVDNKTYVFLDRATMTMWKDDVNGNIRIARKLWPEIR